jgi:hypothetical protein
VKPFIIIIVGLILVCIACMPAISATYVHYSGPGGWSVEQNLTPIINPNTGLPYTSDADYMQNAYPDQWNNTTPEGRANEEAMPAVTGVTMIFAGGMNDITDEEMARIVAENMTTGEVYAWLVPDFWAAVVAVGRQNDAGWDEPWVMHGDPITSAPSVPAVTLSDGSLIPLDSPEAESMFTEQQIRFFEGKIPVNSLEMKSILGDQQWNMLNRVQSGTKMGALTSTNEAVNSLSGMNGITPNIQAFQSVSGSTKSNGTSTFTKSSNTGFTANLINKLGHKTS